MGSEMCIRDSLKAWLMILGNHQTERVDCTRTFAPVAKMVTVWVFLAVVAIMNWQVHQTDVHNVFQHGDPKEEVYMKLPLGFQMGTLGQVSRL